MRRVGMLLLLPLLLLGACAERPEPLRIGGNLWLGYQPFYLAAERGLFGRDVRMLDMPTSLDTARAFRQGELDGALMTLDEALLLAESGMALCIPLVMSHSNGADTLLVREPLESLAQLRGLRIGVENTAVAAHMLARALEIGGLSLHEIHVVPLELVAQRDAFLDGQVDGVITFEPLRSQLLAAGAYEVFSSAAIPDEISDLLVVRPDLLTQRPLQFARMLEGWFGALALLHQEPPDSTLTWLARRSELSEKEAVESLALIRFYSLHNNLMLQSNSQHPFRHAMRQMNEHMLTRRVIGTRLPVDSLICGQAAAILYPIAGEG